MESDNTLVLFKAKDMQKKLEFAMIEGVNAVIFCNFEGSPLASASRDKHGDITSTYAAMISDIFYECVELGQYALNNNNL